MSRHEKNICIGILRIKRLKKINQLIVNIMRNGVLNGIGKPESIKGDFQGYLSRHINENNRLVYTILKDNIIEIYFCKDHYDDKQLINQGRNNMSLFSKYINKCIGAYQHELIETHYAEVENMYHKMRGWRHDYRDHIQTMKAYAAAGDLQAISEYLDKLDTDLSTVDIILKTGNKMTDAIINSKISLARAKNINVKADAHIPVSLTISEIDLCIIIGNLFDNAIEASLALPEDKRMIRVYMDIKNTQLYMSFTNFTATGKLKKKGNIFCTNKGMGHGFGLVRIDDIIERYGGYLSRNSEEGAFTTEILLPQK